MVRVAGVDGAPGGWAVVIMDDHGSSIRKTTSMSELLATEPSFDIIAIDMPIGLLDHYEVGGRECDRQARRCLTRPERHKSRASSVFPAPVRGVIAATSWEEATALSKASAFEGKGISKQTFGILPKIREIDDLLQIRQDLRSVVREVHPEVSFTKLAGDPMCYSKRRSQGQAERRQALTKKFPDMPAIEAIEKSGRAQGLPTEDILDAIIACWSALRLARGEASSLPDNCKSDATGLPMAIWF